MDKRLLLETVITSLAAELEVLLKAALDAKEASTNEESKPENQYDTRGLEASYLAGAQAQRSLEMTNAIKDLKQLKLLDFDENTPITTTAFVELEDEEGEIKHFFILPQYGGVKIDCNGKTVKTLSPESPLGLALIQKSQGDSIEVKVKGVLKAFQINQVI